MNPRTVSPPGSESVRPSPLPTAGVRKSVRPSSGKLRRAARRAALFSGLTALAGLVGQASGQTTNSVAAKLNEAQIEDLMKIEVTLVKKAAQPISQSPAAISVITHDDLERSQIRSIPEALRSVPGLDVAQVDAHQWAVSARGFNDEFANKLLVMIDGRSVYTPLFSGVFWDVQNVMMQDIDRIEVVRGPGSTLWGANAVNGVINVISLSAQETQGALASAGLGNQERAYGAFRYGDKLGQDVYFRVYGQYFEDGETYMPDGTNARDAWKQGQGGFRMDWDSHDQKNHATFQGDAYDGLNDQIFGTYNPAAVPSREAVFDRFHVAGGNLLGRFTHTFSEDSDLVAQGYYDRTERHSYIFRDNQDTYDFDLQHRMALGARNDFLWGLDYRATVSDMPGSPTVNLIPERRGVQLFSGFLQDDFALVPDALHLTLGSKFEHNDFTGFEVQPGARLSWTPVERQMVWGAISRAVRTPSLAEDDVTINNPAAPGSPFPSTSTYGNSQYLSEELLAYELGYRAQLPKAPVAFDVALFYNSYDRLRSIEVGPSPTIPPSTPFVPLHAANNLRGDAYGFEIGPTWRVTDSWSLKPSYSYLKMQLRTAPGSTDTASTAQVGDSPQQQFNLRSSMDFTHGLSLNCDLRYVDRLPSLNVPSYTELSATLLWRANKHFEFSVSGLNLLHTRHTEFVPTEIVTQPTQVPRSVEGRITCHF